MDYQELRRKDKKRLSRVMRIVLEAFDEKPELRNIGQGNNLIRYIWDRYGDVAASSIIRIASKIRAEMPEYDTEHNIKNRANAEVSVREYVQDNLFL